MSVDVRGICVTFPAVSAEYTSPTCTIAICAIRSRWTRGWKPYFDELFGGATLGSNAVPASLEAAAVHLIEAFRQRGHFAAKLDPLGLWSPPQAPELRPQDHGVDAELLDAESKCRPQCRCEAHARSAAWSND